MEEDSNGNLKHIPYIRAFNSEGNDLWEFKLDLDTYNYTGTIEDIAIDNAAGVAIFTGVAEKLADYNKKVGFIGKINLDDGQDVYIEEWESDSGSPEEVVGSIEDGIYVAGFKYDDFNGKSSNGSSDAFVFGLSSFGEKVNGNAGAITGSGDFQEGVILSAGAITGDPDGNGTVTGYQWFLNDKAISGATGSTYATTANGAGTYKVALTYMDGQGFTTSVDSPDQSVVQVDNGSGTAGAITGNGDFREGVILSAGAITGDPDGDGTVDFYQWFLNDKAISGTGSATLQTVGTYKVALTMDGRFTTSVDSPDQSVAKIDSYIIKSSLAQSCQMNNKI